MPDAGSARPALSEAALRETLDLLGTVVASMAEKLDRHGQILADVQKAASEGRDAAQAAKAHSDPQRYGRHIGQELDKALDATLDRLEGLQSGLTTDRDETRRSLNELVRQEEAVLQHLHDDLEKAGRWKRRIPFIALFGLVLALGLTIALPRFLAGKATSCAVLGGEWLKENQSGRLACVFYGE